MHHYRLREFADVSQPENTVQCSSLHFMCWSLLVELLSAMAGLINSSFCFSQEPGKATAKQGIVSLNGHLTKGIELCKAEFHFADRT